MTESLKSNIILQLPEFCSTRDLVKIGFWPTEDAAYSARLKGNSPDYIKIGSKIMYTKACILEFGVTARSLPFTPPPSSVNLSDFSIKQI